MKLDHLNFQTLVHCGPLSSVWNFSELIGAEWDHTSKRESVSHNLFYKCANLQKFLSSKSIYFKSPNRTLWTRFQTCRFLGDGLTFSYFWNVISSQILGVRLCKFPISKCNACTVWVLMHLWQWSQYPYLISFQVFPKNCLTVSAFGNFISSLILGDGVCMSTGWKKNTPTSF
jgi:hypothetical protein